MNASEGDITPPVLVMEWVGPARGGHLRLLDQTRLPGETAYIDCHDSEQVVQAIRRLAVRGAPAIGVAGAYGMVVAAQSVGQGADAISRVEAAAEYLVGARPTAVNLAWAVRRVLRRARQTASNIFDDVRDAMLDEARRG